MAYGIHSPPPLLQKNKNILHYIIYGAVVRRGLLSLSEVSVIYVPS